MVSLTGLASSIQADVAIIDSYLKQHGLPQPSFEPDSPSELPSEASVQRARLKVIEAALSLANLATGPADHLRWHCMNNKYDDMALRFLVRFNVFDAVPRNASISYAELSKKVGVPEHRLHRILSVAYTIHYFREAAPGYVAHTSNSALMIGDPLSWAWVLHNTEEVVPMYAPKFVESTQKWGDSKNPLHVGPNLDAEPGKEKLFIELMEDDDQGEWDGIKGKAFRLRRLFDTDRYFGSGGSVKGTTLLKAYDWRKLGKATVVDMSGTTGHLSITIAQAIPDLKFIVQEKDTPWLEQVFEEKLPQDLKGTGRVSIMAWDRLAEQPIKGADAYFISTLLHKTPEDDAVILIRRIVEAMDPKKSRIVIRELVMDGGDPLPADIEARKRAVNGNSVLNGNEVGYEAGLGPTGCMTRLAIGIDMQMLVLFNAWERLRSEWVDLFKRADPRLTLRSCVQPVGTFAAVMEWGLDG